MTYREKVIKGLEWCLFKTGCNGCPYRNDCDDGTNMEKDALTLLKAQEHADSIPIDWLMNYAQLPTEFAISAWKKPEKEAKIKQAKSLDKPMMLDDALELLKAQEARVMPLEEVKTLERDAVVWYEHNGVNKQRPRIVDKVYDDGIIFTDGGHWQFNADAYGKKFRLWTSRPADEQIKVAKWDD